MRSAGGGVRFNDSMRTVLANAATGGGSARAPLFSQLVDLLSREEPAGNPELRRRAIAELREFWPHVPEEARRASARVVARRGAAPDLIELFRDDPSEEIASLFRPPVDPALADGEERVRGLISRIETYRTEQAATLGALIGDWRWECDRRGIVTYLDQGPSGLLRAPLTVFAEDDLLTTAFLRRAPFRDLEVEVTDAGRWLLSGVPFFDAYSGAFFGFRGTASRPEAGSEAGLFGTGASGDSLAEIAHEVRSPLNAIMGFAQMIEGEILGPVAGPHREHAGTILANASRLLGAVEDLTEASQLEAGRYVVEHGEVDVGALVEAAVDKYRALAADRGVGIAVSAGGGQLASGIDERTLGRAIDRLLAAALAAARDETLLIGVQPAGGAVRIFLTRPAAWSGLSEQQLLDPEREFTTGRSEEGPILGTGFGLRLAGRLITAGGGSFGVEPHVVAVTLPTGIAMREGNA